MKKIQILSLLLIAVLLVCGCSAEQAPQPTTAPTVEPAPAASAEPKTVAEPTPVATPTPKPVSADVQVLLDQNQEVWREIHRRDGMEGRLLIPSANINVALFTWIDTPVSADGGADDILLQVRQAIVDNEDSASLYNDGYGNIIADHSNQEFSKLSGVSLGDTAYLLAGDHIISLECDLVTDGTNTLNGITTADGKPANEGEDYTCYTCLEDWTHVLIVGFKITDQDSVDVDRFDQGEQPQPTPVPTPAATSIPVPSTTQPPVPTPIYTPTRSPEPTEEPDNAPARPQQPVDPEAYYDAIIGGYDMYADAAYNYTGGGIDDGYL